MFSFYGRKTYDPVSVYSVVMARKFRGTTFPYGTYKVLGSNTTTFSGNYVRVEIPFVVTEEYPYVCIRYQLNTADNAVYIDCCQIEKVADNVSTASTWEAYSDTSGTVTVTLQNSERKPIVPYITASDDATLTWTDNTVSLSSGANIQVPQLVLEMGNTNVSVTSAGLVSFHYKEGSL